MPVRMTPDQFRGFMNAEWGPDAYWEEEVVLLDGQEPPEDKDPLDLLAGVKVVTLVGGVIYPDQKLGIQAMRESGIDAETFARRWLREQKTTTLLVQVDKELEGALRKVIHDFKGAKVVKS